MFDADTCRFRKAADLLPLKHTLLLANGSLLCFFENIEELGLKQCVEDMEAEYTKYPAENARRPMAIPYKNFAAKFKFYAVKPREPQPPRWYRDVPEAKFPLFPPDGWDADIEVFTSPNLL